MKRPNHRGVTLTQALVIGGSVATVLVASAAYTTSSSMPRRGALHARMDPLPMTADELESALIYAGFTPERLAACGTSEQQVSTMIGHARSQLGAQIQSYRSTLTSYQSALFAAENAERRVASGAASPQEREALDSVRATLASTSAAWQSQLDGIRQIAHADLTSPQVATLGLLRANYSWELPTQYLAENHAEAEWVELRDALTNIRVTDRLSMPPDPAAFTLVSDTNSHEAVAAASTGLQNLSTIQGAWTQAIRP